MYTSLADFYSQEAEKFSQTRKKNRPEFFHVTKKIEEVVKRYALPTSEERPLRVVDMGCGDGRLYRYLCENLSLPFVYTGVDFAQGLLALAKKQKSFGKSCGDPQFVHADMLQWTLSQPQQSVDVVLTIASWQHLETYKQRVALAHGIYRILVYGGCHISVNWCLSDWFKEKYGTYLRKSWWKWILSLGHRDKQNVLIPFEGKHGKYYRLYHIFSPSEFHRISQRVGFVVDHCAYITAQGEVTDNVCSARNSFLVQIKDIQKAREK